MGAAITAFPWEWMLCGRICGYDWHELMVVIAFDATVFKHQ